MTATVLPDTGAVPPTGGRPLTRLAVARVAQAVPTLLGLSLVTFLLIHSMPGGPAQAMAGVRATPAVVEQVNRQLGLDQPLAVQYLTYLGHLVRGQLGTSFLSGASVNSIVATHLPTTAFLIVYAVVIAVLLGVPLALLAAHYKDGLVDRLIRGTVVLAFALPVFWTGIVLIAFLGIRLGWFPTGGAGSGVGRFVNLFLPASCLALTFLAVLVRSLRARLIETLGSDFISAARLKGLTRWRFVVVHVLRNSVGPFIALIGLNMGYLLGTSVVVENVFAVDGVGQQLVGAVLQRDFLVVQGIVLCLGVLVVLVGLVIDLVQSLLDPRLR